MSNNRFTAVESDKWAMILDKALVTAAGQITDIAKETGHGRVTVEIVRSRGEILVSGEKKVRINGT